MNFTDLSLYDLRVANQERKTEWHEGNTESWLLVDWSNELAGETGEACDVVKKIRRVETGVNSRGPRDTSELIDALREEVADVVICADLLAMAAHINLAKAVRDKFNATSKKRGLSVFL